MLGADVDAGLQELIADDRLRFANHLRAAIEVGADGTITNAEYLAGGRIGSTTLRVGTDLTFAAVSMPDRQVEPEFGDGWVRFTQTAGGRTGVPMPRPVSRAPFVQYRAPLAWSTLELTIFADGHSEHRLTGASKFPRHWVYDTEGKLVAKTGLIDMKEWASTAFGKHTPWGDEDSPAFVTEVETALERELANLVMRGAARPKIRKVRAGDVLTRQGEAGDELFLLLDGVLVVDVDGTRVGRARSGRDPRRTGVARRRSPDLDAARTHGVPGRLGGCRAGRPRQAGRAGDESSPRGVRPRRRRRPASSSSPDAGAPVRGARLDPLAGRASSLALAGTHRVSRSPTTVMSALAWCWMPAPACAM